MNCISSAELTIGTMERDFFIELSPLQLAIVCKLLGVHFLDEDTIACYSDETLQKLSEMKGNPLRLKEI